MLCFWLISQLVQTYFPSFSYSYHSSLSFFSFAEAAAAKKAGMQVIVVTRPKNAPLSDEEREEYNTISSLTGLTVTPVQHSGPTPKQPKINHDSV